MTEQIVLKPRLKVIADFAKGEKVIADIGCDHGKISVYLAKTGVYVHAVDISEASLNKARLLAAEYDVKDKISFYCSDGINQISNIEHDAIIIAGMGWRTIGNILLNNIDCVKKKKKIILQPMDSAIEMRKFIFKNDFSILDESLVWDEGRLYTVIVAVYKASKKLSLREEILGPMIIQNNDALLQDKIKEELILRKNKLKGLNKARIKDEEEIRKVEEEIKAINEE